MVSRLQNRAIRIINFSNYRDHADPIFKNLSILKLSDNVKFQNLLHIYDSINSKLPSVLNNIYQYLDSTHSYRTRNSLKPILSLPKVDTTVYGLNSIEYKSITAWNNLINDHALIKFYDISRSNLKNIALSYFLSKYI